MRVELQVVSVKNIIENRGFDSEVSERIRLIRKEALNCITCE